MEIRISSSILLSLKHNMLNSQISIMEHCSITDLLMFAYRGFLQKTGLLEYVIVLEYERVYV
jgi:hypothetical protein